MIDSPTLSQVLSFQQNCVHLYANIFFLSHSSGKKSKMKFQQVLQIAIAIYWADT